MRRTEVKVRNRFYSSLYIFFVRLPVTALLRRRQCEWHFWYTYKVFLVIVLFLSVDISHSFARHIQTHTPTRVRISYRSELGILWCAFGQIVNAITTTTTISTVIVIVCVCVCVVYMRILQIASSLSLEYSRKVYLQFLYRIDKYIIIL